TLGKGAALNSAGIDDAAVPVLPEVGVAPRAGTVVRGSRRAVRRIEQRAIPPGISVGAVDVGRRGQRSGVGPVGPGTVRRVPAAAGPNAPGYGAGGQTGGSARIGEVGTRTPGHSLRKQHGVARAVFDLDQAGRALDRVAVLQKRGGGLGVNGVRGGPIGGPAGRGPSLVS